MANFKKLETLLKNFEAMSEVESLSAIINCTEVDASTLSANEKLAVLVFAEMAKALETKEHFLVLDCNYPQSKFHNKTEAQIAKGQNNEWKVDYFRLVSKASKNTSMIQFYVHPNVSKGYCNFRLCTSCADANRKQFEAMEERLKFKVQRRKDGTPKTTERTNISYEDLVEVVKAVCAVLATQPKNEKEPETEE